MAEISRPKPGKHRPFILIGGLGAALLVLLIIGAVWLAKRTSAPEEAPEAERVLAAQAQMPFQVYIPGFLPRGFKRDKVLIESNGTQAGETPTIRLEYPARKGHSLVIEQRLAGEGMEASGAGVRIVNCRCQCQAGSLGDGRPGEMDVQIGPLFVTVKVSAPDIISMQELMMALNTMGPAANRQVYSAMENVPLSELAPPAVDIEVNAEGIQEVTLVVTPNGYQPVHFSVKKDIPVRLIFRQVGYVSCGNELLFTWGKRDNKELILSSTNDKQVLEFTPKETGEFRFNCPHLIYQGLMTVRAE